MRGLLLLFSLLGPAFCQHAVPGDLDPLDDINELEFEEYFHVDHVNDTAEEGRREEALKENEALVHEINEEFEKGNSSWSAEINEFANLPLDEFEAMETGAIEPEQYARGLLQPDRNETVDQQSEDYFNQLMINRQAVPDSYSSVDLGLVSPVKHQQQCGSCVAFSNMAVVETCFKKITGVFGDYSEQQFVDCGYGQNGANGCNGAWANAYLKWATDNKADLFHEYNYPYLNTAPKLTCPSNIQPYNQGAKVENMYFKFFDGTEDLLKTLVYTHGAVTTTINTDNGFDLYKQGIFDGCTSQKQDHAVTVVGYGTENGVDYWLIKNSWGPNWGDKGFVKLKRGVGMCGIAKDLATVTCTNVGGPISETPTTQKPCIDQYSNCGDLAVNGCYKDWMKTSCEKSCGLCEGMTPAPSNTCYDVYGNCATLALTACYQQDISDKCKKSCGLCPGMTPAASYTCYDKYSNCGNYASYCSSNANIATSCKKTCNTCNVTAG